ncbi:MAG: methionyl-tRNA formyltransferase [Cyanobacteria bacterium]|nr:methionyl-tRNA formyltransferase [Cyanobacteriota bacterium]MDW8200791.1 methionyl-tRNA formyltransferase [Cyanobacteriota bacterium SKYGB_h_bin112]
MRLVFFGTPQFAVPSLETLLNHPEMTVIAVVTQPDKRRGRGNTLLPSPVKVVADRHHIPVWQPQRIKRDEITLANLAATNADAFVVVAYGQILSQQILDMPRLGCINAHGSILPYYRGAAPIQWSLYHGEVETGVTTMLMDAGMDTGDILLTMTTPISLLDNAQDLSERLAAISADLLVNTLKQLQAGSIQPIPQDHDRATYAPLIQKHDYYLDWTRSAIALHNQVRGFYPSCVTRLQGSDIKITATLPLDPNLTLSLPPEYQPLLEKVPILEPVTPGTVVTLIKGYGPVVQTGSGYLLLREVQPAGKRPQSGWDFVNGSRLTSGDQFEQRVPCP